MVIGTGDDQISRLDMGLLVEPERADIQSDPGRNMGLVGCGLRLVLADVIGRE
jgi:hypothetical protein